MPIMQNAYANNKTARAADGVDWSSEIGSAPIPGGQQTWPVAETGYGAAGNDGGWQSAESTALARGMRTPALQMNHGQSSEVVEMPTDLQEAYLGSLKAMLNRNRGNYIVATFLIGTQNTVSWEGILYEVGNDFITIYQPGRNRYIVTDMYSLKYIEFYDVREQELRGRLQNG